jgi:hypothetical protein
MTTTTQEGNQMSAILELSPYQLRRNLGELEGDANDVADHLFETIRKFKDNEERIIDLATKVARYSTELVETIQAGNHAHNWIQSPTQDLTLALNARESHLDQVKVALYLAGKFIDEATADRVRTAVFG